MNKMCKEFLLCLLVACFLASFVMAADTNWQLTRVAEKATRTIPMALGSAITEALDGTSSITLNVDATTGRGELPQIMTLSNVGQAISTIDVIVLDNMSVGDVVILQTYRASEDVVVLEDDSTIYLGGESRTLSDPADELWLRKKSSTEIVEVGYFDNN